jgi:demethylmenaquinone methyltransferase / 2-methoxy-6-polyprenyl-1,4-benzoquinol methylase
VTRDTLEPRDVEKMFDRIAGPYDTMNHLMTAGLDRRWRELAAESTGLGNGATALDACCGTGDLTLALARRVGRGGQVTGLDFSGEMLERARRKPREADAAEITWVQGDATAMPFADNSFAAVTIGFGLRNLPDPEAGLRELSRVVRPGGKVVVLEITQPASGPLKPFYGVWFNRVVPALGKMLDSSAYSYLPASVRRFPSPDELGRMFWRAGMRDVRFRLLASGIVALHTGEVV